MRQASYRRVGLIQAFCLAFAAGVAQAQITAPPPSKTAQATPVTFSPPRIDGSLDDSAWSTAAPISDFVQKLPTEGGVPSERTEVRILHDDDALYIGARLYRKDP